MLWDDTIAAFAPAAAYGFAPTEQSTFEQSLIHLGDLPEFDQLFATGAPTVLYAVDSNPRLNKTLIANTGFESLLLIPLLSQGIVLGAMLVDCENALLTSNTSEMFLDERLIILQGIAHQTAAAVENTRLREAQQAEAYVSAALLQVSQAVSSSTDLDDTLSAIVRITPILVGVEYCLLYLWDETRTAFWLAQSYGLSQEQEAVLSGQIYEPGNFGLLDDVRERNSLATHLFAGMEGEREMLPLDLSRTLEMEQKTPRPLLAVPLSVQGQVLGAMLTVMPRTEIRAGSNTQENTRENTREKQLEIITGIAQQAAMAVQNERLQQERVGREQLERELELAREIQQIFIPRTLPHLQGWELGAIWYAARQVAGDFYDLIELPDQRLGVIVADVADKGMPAALFMALTRTLVRATALEEISPAAVLGRGNDLLVPDAQHGMFVTAAYAVLSLKTGKVTYANAGHCLPLRVSASGKVERLPKGDMALGVVAGIQPAEHNTTLEIGDSLVLYTDGVTETFSPAGDLFGEERLQDVLDSARNRPAQAILEAILTSVHVFSDNAPASDDLTLVVLRRTTES
jgi:serine phosphatase RsbU (regulator of sigma subunit)